MKMCAVCSMETPSLWQNIPVCTECRFLGKQLMVERPTMTMRQALIATQEMIKKGIDFALAKAEKEEADAMATNNSPV